MNSALQHLHTVISKKLANQFLKQSIMRNHPDFYDLDLLYIDDSLSDQRLLQEILSSSRDVHFNVQLACTLEEAEMIFQRSEPDIILSDLNLADYRGKDTIDKVLDLFQDKPVILLTETKDMEISRYASTLGIQDFLVKGEDFQTTKLARSIQMAAIRYDTEYRKLLKINEELRKSLHKLKESQVFISNQVSHFSHKVRGPICTIEGLLNLMEKLNAAPSHVHLYDHLRNSFTNLKGQVDTTVNKLDEKLHSVKVKDE